MPYYEIIYETGSHSLGNYKDDEEMFAAVKAHHARAIAGEVGGPSGHRAERIARVEKYSVHPGSVGEGSSLSADEAKAQLDEALKASTEGDVVDLAQLQMHVRDLGSPIDNEAGPQDSEYKLEADEVFTEGWE